MRIIVRGPVQAALLNDELATALGGWNKFRGSHTELEAIVDCDAVDQANVEATIAAHLARTPAEQAAALKDYQARLAVDGYDRLQFEHLFNLENTTRDLKAKINQLAPGTYPAGQASQITAQQYRISLINRWKELNQ